MTEQWFTFPIINEIAIEIGPIAIRWYALAYLAGIFTTMLLMNREAKKVSSAFEPEDITRLTNFCVIGIIIGGRLGFVLFYNFDFYISNPIEIFKVWNGGMSFHGGLLGVIIATILTVRKTKIPIFQLSDLLACLAPIGLFLGRIANFINGELYGRITNHPVGIIFPKGGPLPRHPSQLYEAVLEGLLLFLILNGVRILNPKLPNGLITGMFFLLYGLSRIIVEFVREPDTHIGFLGSIGTIQITTGQLLTAPMILIGGILIYFSFKRNFDSR